MISEEQALELFRVRYKTNDTVEQQYDFSRLIGEEIQNIVVDDDSVMMLSKHYSRPVYLIYHMDDCCEDVYLEDICGDLEDLIEEKITMAELVTKEGDPLDPDHESNTWSFLSDLLIPIPAIRLKPT